MSTMNISLSESLKAFVDSQVKERGYGTSSEYVCELIRKEQDRQQLRGLLLAGAASSPTRPVGAADFDALRQRVRAARGARMRRTHPLAIEAKVASNARQASAGSYQRQSNDHPVIAAAWRSWFA